MDLWIRSQDKEDLIKTKNIRCWNDTQIAVNVLTSFNNVDYVVVGEYLTKERALEVLDEIQNHLENQDTVTAQINTDGEVVNQICYKKIFEMPKE